MKQHLYWMNDDGNMYCPETGEEDNVGNVLGRIVTICPLHKERTSNREAKQLPGLVYQYIAIVDDKEVVVKK